MWRNLGPVCNVYMYCNIKTVVCLKRWRRKRDVKEPEKLFRRRLVLVFGQTAFYMTPTTKVTFASFDHDHHLSLSFNSVVFCLHLTKVNHSAGRKHLVAVIWYRDGWCRGASHQKTRMLDKWPVLSPTKQSQHEGHLPRHDGTVGVRSSIFQSTCETESLFLTLETAAMNSLKHEGSLLLFIVIASSQPQTLSLPVCDRTLFWADRRHDR